MDGTNIATGQTTIPVGIAVARQRLQETAQATSPILKPDISRYGIGLSDLTGCTTPSLSQSMYFTGTNSTMLPLSDAMTMGVSTRQTPTLWQYPSATLPIEPILPSPVGYQLMREPSTGQLVMLPSTTTIEPFQPTVVWPQYTQATAAYTSQPSQLMLPPQMSQALQPPPLAPLQLLGPDYLASATLHQHTQTQHTRLVALTADGKRKTANGMPLPLTSHAFVKIEDMSAGGMSPHQSLFEPEKCLQSQFAAAMAGQTDIQGQIFYQHPANLIQIAPQNQTTTIMESSTTECRPLSPVVHHPCLTPPPEEPQNDIHHDDERHHQTILPDVQDANIQTSPVMSEEENSNDDDTQNSAAVPESTTSQDGDMCMSSTFLQNHHSEDANAESCVVSSSETIVPTIKPKVEVVTPEKCVIFPSRFASSLNESISNNNNNATAPSGCDVSGLELLSRSIEVFHKKTTTTVAPANIKLEPLSPQPEPSCLSPTVPHHQMQQQHQPTHSDLGGLNLLCALAEQRFQEEVGSDANCKKSSPSSSSMEDYEARKRKHKHSSSKKSSKRSKRERSGDRKRKRYNNDDDRIKSSFHRIKQKYSKCSCPDRHDDGHRCHQSNWPTTEHIISVMETEVKDRLITMMRKREEVKREIVMAKNLKDIKTLSSDRESSATPPSLIMKPSSLSNLPSMKFSSIPALSPNFSSSSNSSTTMVEIPKVLSDTDSSKFDEQETSSSERSSKRKGGTPKRHDDSPNTETIVAKKPKSLIGYILASKDRVSDTNVKGMVYANSMEEMKMKNHKQYASPSLELYTTDSSDSSYNKAKQPSAFKYEHDDDSSKPSSSAFSIFGDKNELKKAHKRRHDKRKKTKKQLKEKRKIDARCILKPHQLDQDKLRVLTSMGGLFYAGCLSAIQAPDIYAVTLDGERGNRPHIMSREEILRDAIMEVAPRSAEELPIGTRICAYWSQQYRCLYPGTVTAPSSPDSDNEGKFVNVEFDDGDNGRISIEDIRFLLSNYPIVVSYPIEYDADPLDRKGKQKRAPSTTLLEHDHILPACSNIFNATCVLNRNEVDAYREERKKLKKIHKEREREEERKHRKKYKCIEDECKHKKHKKRRKHKKHHHLTKEEAVDGHISPDDSVSQIGSFSQLPMNGSSTLTIEPKNAENVAAKDDTEEENGSTVTESSGSLYQPKFLKKATCQQGTSESSKIAAFLPARQLWTWQGKGFKRSTGRVKKQFYKTIQRGKETISVGDSAVFLSTGRPDRPYIGHIESMWETAANNMVVRVKWFYHPEETEGAPNMKYPGALFESPHEDENDVQTISHKCEVLPIDAYTAKFGDDPKKYKSIYDNNDTYYKAGFYDPTPRRIKMEENIPVLAENETWA